MITLAESQVCPIYFPMALGLRQPLTSPSPACVRSREDSREERDKGVPEPR